MTGKTALATPNREPPRVEIEWTGDNDVGIELAGTWDRILKAAGGNAVLEGLVAQIVNVGAPGKRGDGSAADFALGFMDAMKPRDAAEAALIAQMAVAHQTVMMLAGRLNRAEMIPLAEAADRAFNKAARTYTAQMETLKRYRSKGQQVVRVERVEIKDGGQAVVGNVQSRGGDYES